MIFHFCSVRIFQDYSSLFSLLVLVFIQLHKFVSIINVMRVFLSFLLLISTKFILPHPAKSKMKLGWVGGVSYGV
jgi:hypothetical protein